MGTRNLTCVVSGGKMRVAQYGQFDGYPDGQGKDILEFLREVVTAGRLGSFRRKVECCRFLDGGDVPAAQRELDAYCKAQEETPSKGPGHYADVRERIRWPGAQFSRETAGSILRMIDERVSEGGHAGPGPVGLLLKNSEDFAGDSLFCEWGYVVDLDAGVLEVYKGFNYEPVPAGNRFQGEPQGSASGEKYYPIRLVRSYKLDALPEIGQFIEDLCPPEEDEDEDGAEDGPDPE